MRSSLLILLTSVAGCSSHHDEPDAAVPIDAAMVEFSCDGYCMAMARYCSAGDAQYGGTDSAAVLQSCKQTCSKSFAPGTSVDETSGNTLGCRIHYVVEASKPNQTAIQIAADCMLAGPAGDALMAPSTQSCGDPCTSFCTLEIKACGSQDAPLDGDPKDGTNNSIYQFANMANCMRSCAKLDNSHPYSSSAKGDSLACRLYQATQAVIDLANGIKFCADTASVPPTGRCMGPATP